MSEYTTTADGPVDPLDSGVVDWVFDGRLAERGYTDADLSVTARILSRPCPNCAAPPGEWCRRAGDLARPIEHIDDQHQRRRWSRFQL